MGDIWIGRIGVSLLGLTALVGTVIGGVVSYHGREVPPFIAGMATSAIATLGVVVLALKRQAGQHTQVGGVSYRSDKPGDPPH